MVKSIPFASVISPQFAILGFLYFHPMHGYDLQQHLDMNLREVWHISQSQAYNILKRLEKEGRIYSTNQPQEKRPDRKLYSLTDIGRTEFDNWLCTPTPSSARAIRVEFITRLFFAIQISKEVCLRLLQEQEHATQQGLERLQKRLSDIPPSQVFNRLGLELRVQQLLSMLEWMDTCEPNLLFLPYLQKKDRKQDA